MRQSRLYKFMLILWSLCIDVSCWHSLSVHAPVKCKMIRKRFFSLNIKCNWLFPFYFVLFSIFFSFHHQYDSSVFIISMIFSLHQYDLQPSSSVWITSINRMELQRDTKFSFFFFYFYHDVILESLKDFNFSSSLLSCSVLNFSTNIVIYGSIMKFIQVAWQQILLN